MERFGGYLPGEVRSRVACIGLAHVHRDTGRSENKIREVRSPLKKQWRLLPKEFHQRL